VAKVTNPPTKRADEACQKAPVPHSMRMRIASFQLPGPPPSGTKKGPENRPLADC
jgi:hypothetical protein